MDAVDAWRSLGTELEMDGDRLFVIDHPPAADPDGPPALLVHGFPTSSFDWRHVLPALAARRRVVLLDLLGFGLSDKPDRPYSLFRQADVVEHVARSLGLEEVVLVTHDMGDSVGGELLARALDGSLSFEVTARALTNGSIYMDLVQLSAGQQLLLALPDEMLPPEQAFDLASLRDAYDAICGPATPMSDEELRAQHALLARAGGDRLLPRLVRYIGERLEHEERWTGAIERHPSPLTIVWGDADPIAVVAMARRLAERRPDATLVPLAGIGHFPMIEAPEATAAALVRAIDATPSDPLR